MRGFENIQPGDTLRNAHSGETFRVTAVKVLAGHLRDVTAISNEYGGQVAIPRHQFVEGDFVKAAM